MSQQAKHSAKCPRCGSKQEFSVWESINVTEEPKLKVQVLKRELDKFTCENCAETISVKHPIQYHDVAAKLMFWLAQGEGPKPPLAEDSQVMGLMASSGYVFRRVNSYNELVEKIRLFDDRQDDRAVEALKLAVRAERKVPAGEALFYDGVANKEGGKKIIRLTCLAHKKKLSFEVPVEELVRQSGSLSRTAAPEAEGRKWLCVDEKYAAERLKGSRSARPKS
jgi:hypothetical protein